MGICFSKVSGMMLHYHTVKIVDIQNKKVAAIYRVIQLLVLAYVVGYVIIYKKEYQEFDQAISTVTTKLKGSTFVDFGDYAPLLNGIQVYDPTDYVIPPQELNTFFVMTNMIITPNQTQGKCPENIEHSANHCQKDEDCQPSLEMVKNGNGVRTGSCVVSSENSSVRVCEIYGWCPTEIDYKPLPVRGLDSKNTPLLGAASEFTVLIKNQIFFPKFDVHMSNIHSGFSNRSLLKRCRYNKHTNPTCPIMKLGDILDEVGDNFTQVGYKGGIYGIQINWNCDFDYPHEDCLPAYDFRRINTKTSSVSTGYNFRYSTYHVTNGKRYRTLTKAFGIRFHVLVHTRAGKFSAIQLLMHLGAGLALMVVANVWCDIIVLNCMKQRRVYDKHKFERIRGKLSPADDEETHTAQFPVVDFNGPLQSLRRQDKVNQLTEGAAEAILEDDTCASCCVAL